MKWVEIEWEVLSAQARSSAGPIAARTPYMARARGFLLERPGDAPGTIAIRTVNGRQLEGRLVAEYPGYTHSFGHPLPPWVEMAAQIRKLAHGEEYAQTTTAEIREDEERPR